MNSRKRAMWKKPLLQRRDGKKILAAWVLKFVYQWASEPVTAETVNEWHLNDFDCRIEPPRCKRCWDTGHVGCGPAPPLTGISCSVCDLNERRSKDQAEVAALRERVRRLEAELADRILN